MHMQDAHQLALSKDKFFYIDNSYIYINYSWNITTNTIKTYAAVLVFISRIKLFIRI